MGAAAAAAPTGPGGCAYTPHPGTTYLGPDNVIECENAEGLAGCRARCTADAHCAGFGLYTSGPSKDRCCTKRNNDGAHAWNAGTSYTKEPNSLCPFTPSPPPPPHRPPPPLPPAPPSAPAEISVIFRGNSSYPYNKGAMIQPLPGGRIAAACQAGAHEASGDQRILTAISPDGRAFPEWTAAAPQPPGLNWAQWEPTLFLAPDNRTLWLFYSEGPKSPGPSMLYAATAAVSESSVGPWSKPRAILNVTAYSATASKPYKYMYPISRVVISDGAWLLPCDWGCGDVPTGAFTVRSETQGKTWTVDEAIPGLPTLGYCPEPAMAAVNSTTMLAVVRSKGAGFTQSWTNDGGHHWTSATQSSIDGAASKPALESYRDRDGRAKVVLAYNVVTRERMALSSSTDGGSTWEYFATLDNGTSPLVPGETSDAYPTVAAAGNELLTTWSTYGSGGGSGGGGYNAIKLARTALP